MTRFLSIIASFCVLGLWNVVYAQNTSLKHTDFVVIGDSSAEYTDLNAGDVAQESATDGGEYIISGDIGTFWSAAGKLAYVRKKSDAYELVYDGYVAAESSHPIVQLGDITASLAYCEVISGERVTGSVAHIGSTRSYTFPENICNASSLSGSELISYGRAVYVNGIKSVYAVREGVILNAFRYKNSLVYIPSFNAPFETRLMVGPTKLASAPGLEGSVIEAAVQGGKLVYSLFKPEAGWTVIWGGEVVSRYHAYIIGFLKNAEKLTYIARTPQGVMLFRGNKVYGVGYDAISFMHETPRGNLLYVTTKTSNEQDYTRRKKLQDVLWFNGTKLLQSLYAQNIFAKVVVIADAYPLVIVEDLWGTPQYIWYQGRIGLRGQKVINAAQSGNSVALLIEHKDASREIIYIAVEQE